MEERAVYLGQGGEVGELDPVVCLLLRRSEEAEFGCRPVGPVRQCCEAALRAGRVSCHHVLRQTTGHAAAPADLDHVAECVRAGRLADEAAVDPLAALLEPTQNLARAVDRVAFLVPSNQQADRSGELLPTLTEETLRRRDKGGDRPLHVDSAAAAQRAIV